MPTQCPQAGKLGGKKNGVIVHTDVSALVRIMAAGIIKFSKGELVFHVFLEYIVQGGGKTGWIQI